ncbi:MULTISPECIES: NUDIX domain-containing protein [unclassified Streptomyces]|uniref:NUDIX hydrolase n=1 Tax=Streptomyces TaxID=1883 RepID=UPI0013E39C98|nr:MULTISPECIES: NUDIX domain-containing protein [unclassified Streptomyces]UQA32354.1 NUDIX hydrolase [Streptomyces sp. HNA39]
MTHVHRERLLLHVTADLVILTIRHDKLYVLLVERGTEPFRGRLALPGGFMRGDETVEETAARELHEETRLDADALHLEQLGVYSAPKRDPRDRRVVTCAFLAIAPRLPAPTAGSDAGTATFAPVAPLLTDTGALAFDHSQILRDAVKRARDALQFTTVATSFCDPEFTITELRGVYETVWDVRLDPPNFHRKVTEAEGLLVPTGRRGAPQGGRPATLYRAGPATRLTPPMMRPSPRPSP